MPSRFSQLIAAGVLGVLMLAVIDFGTAQDPKPIPLVPPGGAPQPDPNAPPDGAEVLARGPVHEAFATTAEAPAPEPVVNKQPPEPIEELPPDQKPEGDNVQWIPGYWDWDEDSERFFWISGCWRDTPPGRLWVPGSWRQVLGGWQWVSGFWQEPQAEEPAQPQLTYLPVPPQTLEVGPTVAAPTTTSFYVPGSWVWRQKYVWRPGVWVEYRPNWIWVPAHFRWTPLGHVFVDGYWDYTLASRGVLFAPIVFTRPIRPQFVYTPVYVVSEPALVGALFVRRGRPTYYFGDYFEPRYVNRGYNPWAGRVTGTTFAVGFGTGRTWGYDPLWSHYAVTYRTDPVWNTRVNTLYTGRYTGNVARPPVTLVQQNTVISKITNVTNVTNVTNNITVVNNVNNNTRQVTVNNQNVTDVAMIAPVSASAKLQPEARIKTVTAEVRQAEARSANQTREVGVQRNRAETAAVAKLPPMPKANPKVDPKQPDPPPVAVQQPQTLKLEVPKTAVTRAQISKDEKKAPPPPAIRADAKVEPKATPKVDPKGTPDPKVTPKVDPKMEPKPKDPMPDPKGKVDPKPDPKVEPKGKVDPKADPKVEPKGKVDPKPDPKPKEPEPKGKVDPKPKDPLTPMPMPKTEPKVEPKPKEPPVPVPMPKTEPKVEPKPKTEPKKVEPLPDPKPKVEPKKVDPAPVPLPKVEPKAEPKKEPAPAPKPKDPVPAPKVEPKAPAPPPVPLPAPAPKVEPKAPPAPIPVPKVEPKAPAPPPAPAPAPKVEPKAPIPVPVPKVEPKAEPPKVEPKKGEPKKGNEPKKDPTP